MMQYAWWYIALGVLWSTWWTFYVVQRTTNPRAVNVAVFAAFHCVLWPVSLLGLILSRVLK